MKGVPMKSRARVLAVLAVFLAGFVSAQEVEVKTTHVAGNVYMLEGGGGNIGVLVGDDGVILVDDQMEPVLDKIKAAIAELSKGELRFIINTHYHGDHVGNNAALSKGATIISHTNVRERLRTPQEIWGETREPLDPAAWPILTFDHSVSLHFNGEEIKVIHVPRGHTDGDAMVYFTGSNVLHAGDQLFSGLFPYVDLEHGGTLEGYIENIDYALETFPADARVIPGHGPLSTMADLVTSRDMIIATTRIVREKMEAGKTLDEIKADGLPDFASFDWNFITTDRWIETIWNSYSN
jgi:glyoxylase-like metal-dependent hydrolase (beta-lactamase superfamily II)